MDRLPHMRLALLIALLLMVGVSFSMPETVSAMTKKPNPVTVIKATPGYDSITLEWKASEGATDYIVYRASSKYGLYKSIRTVTVNHFTDRNLETGIAQWYKIRAVNDGKRARKSPRISAVPRLAAPGLKAEASGDGIALTIDPVDGADGYVIYRDGKSLTRLKSLTYLDNDTYADKRHRYRVIAYRHIGQKVVPSGFSREITAIRPSFDIGLKGTNTIPEELHEGEGFKFKGLVRSNTTIRKITVGIVNGETQKWIKEARYVDSDLNSMEFDLKKVNKKIQIKDLPQGSYTYQIIVELKTGSEKTLLNQSFNIIQPPGSTLIIDKALECAWPKGTSSGKYSYPGGSRTAGYSEAIVQAYGSRSGWSAQTKAGASCDVFVGTVIRASGYDPTFPRGLDEIESYCARHTDKWENTGITSESQMQPGDVLFQLYSGGGGHIAIYLGDGLVANAHYHGKSYGVVQDMHNGGGISRHSWKTFKVYRPIQ